MIKEITVKSALHYHNKKFATNYDLNIYRGCEHKCRYCFAQYSHKYLESDFFNDIYVKTNIAEILDLELSKKSWKHDIINISGVCDCYQPLEEKYKLMENVLKVLIKHKNPAFILTKSPLILRDFDLIDELSKKTDVCIATTVTTLDENIRQKIEPNTYTTIDRLNMISKFTELKCETNVMLMPIIPYLTDTTSNIESIYATCNRLGIKHMICGSLHLRGNLKTNFYNFLKKDFPKTFHNIQHLYKGNYVSREYVQKLNKFLLSMKRKYKIYNLNTNINRSDIIEDNDKQLDLFRFSNFKS